MAPSGAGLLHDDRRRVADDPGGGGRTTDESYWVFLAGLCYRPCAGVVSALGLALAGTPHAELTLVAVALAVSLALALVAVRLQERRTWRPDRSTRVWLAADSAALVMLNLWASTQVQGSLALPFKVVFWSQVQGLVAMWWAVAGGRAAFCAVATGFPLIAAMIALNGQVAPADRAAVVLINLMWLGLAVLAVAVLRRLLATRGTVALDEGVETGQELQRLRHLREVHDTVLQTLEGIALHASMAHVPERQRLAAISDAARAEASRLREGLRRAPTDATAHDLDAQLAVCVDGFRARGLRVDLDILSEGRELTIDPAVARAVRDATFEALTNVVKHASARHVRVRLSQGQEGLEVLVEDDGRGFDPRRVPERFGVTQSIRQRLADVGGVADVRSAPATGTRVVLRVGIPPHTGEDVRAEGRWWTPRSGLALARLGR